MLFLTIACAALVAAAPLGAHDASDPPTQVCHHMDSRILPLQVHVTIVDSATNSFRVMWVTNVTDSGNVMFGKSADALTHAGNDILWIFCSLRRNTVR